LDNNEYIFLVYAAFFVSIVLFCLLINTILLKFSTTLGIRDKEKPLIRWSSVSKPALGGISFYISFLISTASYGIFFNSQDLFNDGQIIGLIASVSLAFLMGLADDAYNTKPWLKFFVQFGCGVILILSSQFTLQDKSLVINIFNYSILNYILTIIWVIGIMNSINMLDNMDGITSITSLFIMICALVFLGIDNSFNQYDFMILIGAIGSLIGFLFYNWHPSKMFMGDSGSQFLGLLIAAIGIKYFWNVESIETGEVQVGKQVITVLIVFTLPIVDTTAVVINRLARKRSPFVGGKDHTTHHLSYLGFTDTQISFIFAGISFISCLIAITIYRFVDHWSLLNSILFFLYFIAIFFSLFITTQQHKELRK
jgi:UDP-GlcNAc:undecaprenyl-phosphate GlcNAc-1-phosphate transferase